MFAAGDHPEACGPGPGAVEHLVDEVGDLGDFGVIAPVRPVSVDRWLPGPFRHVDEGTGDVDGELVTDHETGLRSRPALTKSCDHPAVSARTMTSFSAGPSSSWASASPSTRMWSVAVPDPALRGCSTPASVSPVTSRYANSRWNPKPRFHVRLVGVCVDECDVDIGHVEPRIRTRGPRLRSSRDTRGLDPSNTPSSIAARVRHAVGCDAPVPNSSG